MVGSIDRTVGICDVDAKDVTADTGVVLQANFIGEYRCLVRIGRLEEAKLGASLINPLACYIDQCTS